MNPLRLIVVRHGQTFGNVNLAPESGCTQWDLSPAGREECRHLARALAGRIGRPASVAIYSSTAGRAVNTARAIRAALGGDEVPLVVTNDLLELGEGELGVEVEDRREWGRFVAEKKKLWQDGGGHFDDFKLTGGIISVREMMCRGRRAVAECLIGRSHQTVVVVAHWFFNNMLFRALLDLPSGAPQHNACINELRVSPESLAVSPGWVLNDTSHLPTELRDELAPPRFDHAAAVTRN